MATRIRSFMAATSFPFSIFESQIALPPYVYSQTRLSASEILKLRGLSFRIRSNKKNGCLNAMKNTGSSTSEEHGGKPGSPVTCHGYQICAMSSSRMRYPLYDRAFLKQNLASEPFTFKSCFLLLKIHSGFFTGSPSGVFQRSKL